MAAGLFFLKQSDSDKLCANSISCIKDLSGNYDDDQKKAQFHSDIVLIPGILALKPVPRVLGQTSGEKRIEVNLSNQHLYAYEGSKLVYDFPVSTGKWAPTPTGTFYIWIKLRYTLMSGGSKAMGTYYYLPNVPYTMFFYNDETPKARGFGLHGTYWHNNFGHPMSHGCVNMRTEDAGKIYYWSDPPIKGNSTYAQEKAGTRIVIYGVTPNE